MHRLTNPHDDYNIPSTSQAPQAEADTHYSASMRKKDDSSSPSELSQRLSSLSVEPQEESEHESRSVAMSHDRRQQPQRSDSSSPVKRSDVVAESVSHTSVEPVRMMASANDDRSYGNDLELDRRDDSGLDLRRYDLELDRHGPHFDRHNDSAPIRYDRRDEAESSRAGDDADAELGDSNTRAVGGSDFASFESNPTPFHPPSETPSSSQVEQRRSDVAAHESKHDGEAEHEPSESDAALRDTPETEMAGGGSASPQLALVKHDASQQPPEQFERVPQPRDTFWLPEPSLESLNDGGVPYTPAEMRILFRRKFVDRPAEPEPAKKRKRDETREERRARKKREKEEKRAAKKARKEARKKRKEVKEKGGEDGGGGVDVVSENAFGEDLCDAVNIHDLKRYPFNLHNPNMDGNHEVYIRKVLTVVKTTPHAPFAVLDRDVPRELLSDPRWLRRKFFAQMKAAQRLASQIDPDVVQKNDMDQARALVTEEKAKSFRDKDKDKDKDRRGRRVEGHRRRRHRSREERRRRRRRRGSYSSSSMSDDDEHVSAIDRVYKSTTELYMDLENLRSSSGDFEFSKAEVRYAIETKRARTVRDANNAILFLRALKRTHEEEDDSDSDRERDSDTEREYSSDDGSRGRGRRSKSRRKRSEKRRARVAKAERGRDRSRDEERIRSRRNREREHDERSSSKKGRARDRGDEYVESERKVVTHDGHYDRERERERGYYRDERPPPTRDDRGRDRDRDDYYRDTHGDIEYDRRHRRRQDSVDEHRIEPSHAHRDRGVDADAAYPTVARGYEDGDGGRDRRYQGDMESQYRGGEFNETAAERYNRFYDEDAELARQEGRDGGVGGGNYDRDREYHDPDYRPYNDADGGYYGDSSRAPYARSRDDRDRAYDDRGDYDRERDDRRAIEYRADDRRGAYDDRDLRRGDDPHTNDYPLDSNYKNDSYYDDRYYSQYEDRRDRGAGGAEAAGRVDDYYSVRHGETGDAHMHGRSDDAYRRGGGDDAYARDYYEADRGRGGGDAGLYAGSGERAREYGYEANEERYGERRRDDFYGDDAYGYNKPSQRSGNDDKRGKRSADEVAKEEREESGGPSGDGGGGGGGDLTSGAAAAEPVEVQSRGSRRSSLESAHLYDGGPRLDGPNHVIDWNAASGGAVQRTISKGDYVTWRWSGELPLSVNGWKIEDREENQKMLFSSGEPQKPPNDFRFKFAEAGTYGFECPLYKDGEDALMGGIIFVSEPLGRQAPPGLQNSDRDAAARHPVASSFPGGLQRAQPPPGVPRLPPRPPMGAPPIQSPSAWGGGAHSDAYNTDSGGDMPQLSSPLASTFVGRKTAAEFPDLHTAAAIKESDFKPRFRPGMNSSSMSSYNSPPRSTASSAATPVLRREDFEAIRAMVAAGQLTKADVQGIMHTLKHGGEDEKAATMNSIGLEYFPTLSVVDAAARHEIEHANRDHRSPHHNEEKSSELTAASSDTRRTSKPPKKPPPPRGAKVISLVKPPRSAAADAPPPRATQTQSDGMKMYVALMAAKTLSAIADDDLKRILGKKIMKVAKGGAATQKGLTQAHFKKSDGKWDLERLEEARRLIKAENETYASEIVSWGTTVGRTPDCSKFEDAKLGVFNIRRIAESIDLVDGEIATLQSEERFMSDYRRVIAEATAADSGGKK